MSAGYLLSADDTRALRGLGRGRVVAALCGRGTRAATTARRTPSSSGSIHEPERDAAEIARPTRRTSTSTSWSGLAARVSGGVLIERLLDDLRARGVPGVHLGVDAGNANGCGSAFYEHPRVHRGGPRASAAG